MTRANKLTPPTTLAGGMPDGAPAPAYEQFADEEAAAVAEAEATSIKEGAGERASAERSAEATVRGPETASGQVPPDIAAVPATTSSGSDAPNGAGKASDGTNLADGGPWGVAPTTVEEATPTLPTWSTHLELLDIHELIDHPMWSEILGPEAPEREEALTDDLREGDSTPQIVIITGTGCASPPHTILDGHRYVHAAQTIAPTRGRKVLVVRRTDLEADAEEVVIIKSALRSQHARKIKPSKLAALVERLYKLYARGKGFRRDLKEDDTCVGANAGSEGERRPDTLSQVARAAREPRNAVANLRKVFSSPVSHLALHDAVDEEKLAVTAGADIIREVEGEPDVAEVLRKAAQEKWDDDTVALNPTIQAARSKVEAKVREKLGKPPRKDPPTNDNDAPKRTVEQPGQMEGDTLVMVCTYRSRRTRVTVLHARVVRIEDLGPQARTGKPGAPR